MSDILLFGGLLTGFAAGLLVAGWLRRRRRRHPPRLEIVRTETRGSTTGSRCPPRGA